MLQIIQSKVMRGKDHLKQLNIYSPLNSNFSLISGLKIPTNTKFGI